MPSRGCSHLTETPCRLKEIRAGLSLGAANIDMLVGKSYGTRSKNRGNVIAIAHRRLASAGPRAITRDDALGPENRNNAYGLITGISRDDLAPLVGTAGAAPWPGRGTGKGVGAFDTLPLFASSNSTPLFCKVVPTA